MPSMLNCESLSLRESDGSIIENIRPKKSFSTAGFFSFFMTLRPQKVKKMETLWPVAAAPLASTKVANARSRSSLNMISVLFLGAALHAVGVCGCSPPFSITTEQ